MGSRNVIVFDPGYGATIVLTSHWVEKKRICEEGLADWKGEAYSGPSSVCNQLRSSGTILSSAISISGSEE